MKRRKRAIKSVSSLYLRGEREVKVARKRTGNMLTLELALDRIAKKKSGAPTSGGGHYL